MGERDLRAESLFLRFRTIRSRSHFRFFHVRAPAWVAQDYRAYTNSCISTFWSLKLGTIPRQSGSMGSLAVRVPFRGSQGPWWDLSDGGPAGFVSDNPYDWSARCEWCGWWGYYGSWDLPEQYTLIVMDDLELTTLCMRCHALKEPPWWPNNRDRYHEWLLRIFRPPKLAARDSTYTLRLIAEYIAANKA